MSFKVTVQPSNHQFNVAEGQTVLDAALAADIVLPYSCRNGTCSSCRGKVLSGTYDAGSAPEAILPPEDIEQGYTLFCQAKPSSDMVIEAHEIRMASDIQIRKMPARVMGFERLGNDVMIMQLQLPASDPFPYYAGQYLEFILRDGRRRSYSMATPPTESNLVELHIRHMPGGAFTDHVFGVGPTQMKLREILRVEAPLGSFFLREDSKKPLIFLASGTGFAPIKAMVLKMIAQGDTRPVSLYWGGRRPTDLYMQELAQQWATDLPNLSFIPVISDPLLQDSWTGRTGYVHQAVIDDFPDLSGYQVYACGAPLMVSNAKQDFLQSCGLPEQEFFADAFTSEADTV